MRRRHVFMAWLIASSSPSRSRAVTLSIFESTSSLETSELAIDVALRLLEENY